MDSSVHDIPLGFFDIAHRSSHLKVNAAVSISARRRSRSNSYEIPTSLGVEDLLSAWVCRGRGLKFVLRFDPYACSEYTYLTDVQHVDLWASICQRLCDAELWSQLNLVASLHDEDFLDPTKNRLNGRTGFVVLLSTDRNSRFESDQTTVHRLCCATHPADIRPPTDVDVIELEQITIKLTLSDYTRWMRKRKMTTSSEQNSRVRQKSKIFEEQAVAQVPQPEGLLEFRSDSLYTEDSGYYSSQAQSLARSQNVTWPSILTRTPSTTESSHSYNIGRDVDLGKEDEEDLFASQFHSENPQKWTNGPIEDALENRNEPSSATGVSDAIPFLVDAALRLSIHSSPRRLPAGVLRMDDEIVTFPMRLGQLIPTFFGPGYLPAVAARVALIPTIANALNDVHKNTFTDALAAKMSSLVQSSSPTTGAMPNSDDTNPGLVRRRFTNDRDLNPEETSSSYCRIKQQHIDATLVYLWRHIQENCLSLDAARSLKPLHVRRKRPEIREDSSQVQDTDLGMEFAVGSEVDDLDLFLTKQQLEQEELGEHFSEIEDVQFGVQNEYEDEEQGEFGRNDASVEHRDENVRDNNPERPFATMEPHTGISDEEDLFLAESTPWRQDFEDLE